MILMSSQAYVFVCSRYARAVAAHTRQSKDITRALPELQTIKVFDYTLIFILFGFLCVLVESF